MNILTVTIVLGAAVLSSSTIIKTPESGAIPPNFELLILHNNDMHARFEQTSQLSGTCTTADRAAGKCYGGFPRVAYVVKEARRKAASGEGPPVLYLNAGDTYTGTAWFTIYKWKIAAEFINALKPDAVSLGNHELDEFVDGLVPFVRNISTPVVAANLILDEVPQLKEIENLHNSVILVKNGIKIGIIGYLTPDTAFLAPKNKIKYEDEIPAIRREAELLKNSGVDILIALGHSGYIKDLEIAKNVAGLDLVIGGHSNTFLWNGETTEKPEIPQGPYPVVVNDPSGRKVLVVQAYAYTKYMGSLHLTFDQKGEVIEFDGSPILLDNSIPRDPQLSDMVETYRKDIDHISSEVVGVSNILLNGECRLRECNMGNFITDILLNCSADQYPEVSIAICQSGRIRTSIDSPNKPFNLTKGEWMSVLPFTDTMTIVTMNGSVLRMALENSVALWRPIDSVGQFLQFSGMTVVYDLLKPAGARIVEASAVCSACGAKLSAIKDDYEYKVMMPSFLAEGGDDFSIFVDLPQELCNYNELSCIYAYLERHPTISPGLTGRIKLLNEDKAVENFKIDSQLPSNSPSLRSSSYGTSIAILIFCIVQLSTHA